MFKLKKQFKTKKENRIKVKTNPIMYVVFLILVVWSFVLLFALAWAFICTFKENYFDFRNNMFGLPQEWVFDNYKLVWKEFYVTVSTSTGKRPLYIESLLLYTLYYVIVCGFTALFVPMITAYACAKFPHWISSRIIYTIVILCMVIPIIGSTPSELDMLIKLGLYDTLLVAPFCKSSFLGMYFIMFYGVFRNQAKDYQEAAYLDGANEFQVMFRISIPLVMNMCGIIYLLNVMGLWNEYTFQMLFMPSYPSVMYGLFQFTQSLDTDKSSITVQFAAAFLVMLPILILFMSFSNKIIGSLNVNGGLKG